MLQRCRARQCHLARHRLRTPCLSTAPLSHTPTPTPHGRPQALAAISRERGKRRGNRSSLAFGPAIQEAGKHGNFSLMPRGSHSLIPGGQHSIIAGGHHSLLTARPSLMSGPGGAPPRHITVPPHPGLSLPGHAPRTWDAVLFFHGLNGLELACEAGRVPPGTCVLFNGASMLLDDPGQMVGAGVKAKEVELVPTGTGGNQGEGLREVDREGEEGEETASEGREAEGSRKGQEGGQRPASRGGVGGRSVKGVGGMSRKGTGVIGAGAAAADGLDLPPMVDREAWRRYMVVVTIFKIYGGYGYRTGRCRPDRCRARAGATGSAKRACKLLKWGCTCFS